MIEIHKYQLDNGFTGELNQLCDELIKQMSPDDVLRNAFVPVNGCQIRCDQTQLPSRFLQEILTQAADYSKNFVVNPEEPEYQLDDIWLIEQKEKDFNPLHSHRGEISGVLHLQVPECINRDNAPQGCLQFVYGRGNYRQRGLQPKTLDYVVPRPGVLYLFPAWLYHVVYPFYGAGIRRAISFNLLFKD